jgi:hypothetical protein
MVIGAGGKMAKVAKAESKMATRLPSTGLKMAKTANYTEMGDTSDTLDRIDTLVSGAGWRDSWRRRQAARGQGDQGDHGRRQGDHAFAQYRREGDQGAHVDG